MRVVWQVIGVLVSGSLLMSCSVVEPGKRGIKVTLGEVAPQIYPEGVVWHTPMIGRVISVDIRQQAGVIDAECYSSDLQQVNIKVKMRSGDQTKLSVEIQ